jgi:hypothetical protein
MPASPCDRPCERPTGTETVVRARQAAVEGADGGVEVAVRLVQEQCHSDGDETRRHRRIEVLLVRRTERHLAP